VRVFKLLVKISLNGLGPHSFLLDVADLLQAVFECRTLSFFIIYLFLQLINQHVVRKVSFSSVVVRLELS